MRRLIIPMNRPLHEDRCLQATSYHLFPIWDGNIKTMATSLRMAPCLHTCAATIRKTWLDQNHQSIPILSQLTLVPLTNSKEHPSHHIQLHTALRNPSSLLQMVQRVAAAHHISRRWAGDLRTVLVQLTASRILTYRTRHIQPKHIISTILVVISDVRSPPNQRIMV